MGWGLSDLLDSVSSVGGDIYDSVSDAASSAYDSAASAASDAYDSAAAAVTEAVDSAYESAASAASSAYDSAASAVHDVVDQVSSGAGEAGDWLLSAANDYVFAPVNYVTDGAVDLHYADGAFSAKVGVDGIAQAGIAYSSADGFSAHGEVHAGVVDASIDYDDSGFGASFAAGVDYGPLPYAEGHVHVSDDGEVSVGGKVQGTIPTSAGLLTGSVEGDFAQHADGSWSASGAAEGTLYEPDGTAISAGAHVAYSEEADGDSSFSAGGHVAVDTATGEHLGAGVEYSDVVADGVETEQVGGYVEAGFEDTSARIGGSYTTVDDGQGHVTEQWAAEASATVEGMDLGTVDFGSEQMPTVDSIVDNIVDAASETVGWNPDSVLGQASSSAVELLDDLDPAPAVADDLVQLSPVDDGDFVSFGGGDEPEPAPAESNDFDVAIAAADSFEDAAADVWD